MRIVITPAPRNEKEVREFMQGLLMVFLSAGVE